VKEAALLGKASIVCAGVGDFDEYLQNGHNAFVVPRSIDGSELAEVLRKAYHQPDLLRTLGTAVQQAVLERFAITAESLQPYLALAETLH
jgi:hypothetical protein